MWQDVVPSLMSDEDVGGNTFRIHQPQWCSVQLSNLLSELDRRAGSAQINKSHARKNRIIGTPLKSTAAKDWMIEREENSLSPTY